MMENDEFQSVLLNTFVIKKKRCRVYFHRGKLIWETERPPYVRWTLPLTDAIAVNYGDDYAVESRIKRKHLHSTSSSSSSSSPSPTSFTLHYAASGPKNRWSHHNVVMSHTDPIQVASWVKTIRNYLLSINHRPRRVIVFVNPFGGKKRGIKIWEKQVQPLMRLAGIEMKTIITERAGHISDWLQTCNLNDIEGIVCVGGDGTFAEVFNGLVLRSAKDHHINPNNKDVTLPIPNLAVGVIPSGSTDTVAYSLHGTIDVETAVIHIIFGDTSGLDLSSVHSGDNLIRLYASVLSYGYLGDVIRDSEKFRWMGPRRYDYSGFKKIIANKGYEGEIHLLSDPCHPAQSIRCKKNCSRCIKHLQNNDRDKDITRWLTVRGKFFMVNGANVSCSCSRSPQGFSPHCHIGDGCVDIILVRHTSLFNNVRMLLTLGSKNKTLYDLPFVEVYRAREFTFRASPNNNSNISVWNCDGEVLPNPDVKIRVHCQLLKVFSRREGDIVLKEKFCSCFP